MNSSDSDSDSNDSSAGTNYYKCNCGYMHQDSDDSDFLTEEDDDDSEESSSYDPDQKNIFIGVYNHEKHENAVLISTASEIKNYRKKHSLLSDKSSRSVDNIWDDVKINTQKLSTISLRAYYDYIDKTLKNRHSKNRIQNTQNSGNEKKNSIVTLPVSKNEQKNTKNVGNTPTKSSIAVEVDSKNNLKDLEKVKKSDIIAKEKKGSQQLAGSGGSNSNKNSQPVNKKINDVKVKTQINIPENEKHKVTPLKLNNGMNTKSNSESIVKSTVNQLAKINQDDKKSISQNSSVTSQKSKNGINKTAKNDSEHFVKSTVNEPVKTNPNDKKSSLNSPVVTMNHFKNGIKNTTKNDSEHVVKPIATQSVENDSNDEKLSSNNFPFKKPEPGKVGKTRKTGKTSASDNESVSSEKSQIKNQNMVETMKLDHVENMSHKKLKKLKKFERKVGNVSENITKKKLKKLKQREKVLENDKKTPSKGKTPDKRKNISKDQSNPSSSSSKQASESDTKIQKKEDSELKNHDKTKSITENSDKVQSHKSLENKSSMDIQNIDEYEDKVDSEEEEETDISDNMDYLTGVKNMPTFISEVVKRKQKNGKMIPNCIKDKEDKEKLKVDQVEEFITPTKNHNAGVIRDTAISNHNYITYSEKYAEQAVDLLMENNLLAALEYLCEAIQFNSTDHRHFLNRSYCYLRMNKNVLALEDAQYVLHLSTHVGYLFMANLRAGQASLALQRYEQAETFFGKAVFINPENYHAQRELFRAQINCITAAGYGELDAITALEKFPSSLQAITYLRESGISKTENYLMDSDTCYDSYDDFIYYSSDDDDDDELNTLKLMNHMTNYKPGKRKMLHIITRSQRPELQISSVTALKESFKITEARNSQVNQVSLKPTSKIEGKSVWVGNLTDSITDSLLKKQFEKYGSVLSVYRPINEAYAFINFERNEDAAKCLNDSSLEVAGIKLIIRSATRK